MMASALQTHHEQDIALWGPTGSGKTWLILALGQELKYYNLADPEFSYHLTDRDGRPMIAKPPEVRPTGRPSDRFWRFLREVKKETPAHRLSAHTHDINLHDDKGANLVNVIYSAGQLGGEERLTLLTLLDSCYLLILLDLTLVKDSNLPHDNSTNLMTMGEYAQHVESLCYLLASQPGERYLAVCVTKVDLIGVHREARQLINVYFGQDMLSILENYGRKMKIQMFATSATGFYRDRQGEHANFDITSSQIIYPNRWQPYNIAAPFFWLFENNEKQRLKQQSKPFIDRLNRYIGYPKTRL